MLQRLGVEHIYLLETECNLTQDTTQDTGTWGFLNKMISNNNNGNKLIDGQASPRLASRTYVANLALTNTARTAGATSVHWLGLCETPGCGENFY